MGLEILDSQHCRRWQPGPKLEPYFTTSRTMMSLLKPLGKNSLNWIFSESWQTRFSQFLWNRKLMQCWLHWREHNQSLLLSRKKKEYIYIYTYAVHDDNHIGISVWFQCGLTADARLSCTFMYPETFYYRLLPVSLLVSLIRSKT